MILSKVRIKCFSEQFFPFSIYCDSGLFWRFEYPNIIFDSIFCYPSLPSCAARNFSHPPISRSTPACFLIGLVFTWAKNAEIFFSVIQAIMVDVIGVVAIRSLADYFMHEHQLGAWSICQCSSSSCIKPLTVGPSMSKPFVGGQEKKIVNIDDGALASSKHYRHVHNAL